MAWTDYLPTWSSLTSSSIVLAGLAIIGYFFRDRLAGVIDPGIQYRFDAKFEALRSELASKSREIDDLRAGVLGMRAQRQSNIDRRRLEAIDQLWTAVKILGPLRGVCAMMARFRWPEIANISINSPDAQEVFQNLSGHIPNTMLEHDAHSARPYVSHLSRALFNAYQAILSHSFAQITLLRNGVSPDALREPEEITEMLALALPDWVRHKKTWVTMTFQRPFRKLRIDFYQIYKEFLRDWTMTKWKLNERRASLP